jgi:cell division protease FtsH
LPQGHREYSEETAREIDVAVRDIVKSCYDKAIAILGRERATLERWAVKLLEKETLADAELGELKRALGSAHPQPG